MNGHRWREATDPYELLEYLFPMRGMDSTEPQNRSSRLYYLACARRAWHHLPSICQAFIVWGEQLYHPWQVDIALRDRLYFLAEELIHASGSAERVNHLVQRLVVEGWAKPDHLFLTEDYPPEHWEGWAQLTFAPYSPCTPPYRRIPVMYHSVELLREVFPPPEVASRRSLPRSWRTEPVIRLAYKAYESLDDLDFHILADALEEAGCTCVFTLEHLRSGQPHVRGCWALEQLLGAHQERRRLPSRK
ncbi:MAG: hypothetical protein NZU63_06560, partial [Gemmataceae bacterium]|nr:hypothetical protein [Gemmataceae bacterium]MDW8242636.1 hypothetical protein [Thermogemmata sp.]